MSTTPYYPIYALLSVKWLLIGGKKQTKKNLQASSSKNGRGQLQNIVIWVTEEKC